MNDRNKSELDHHLRPIKPPREPMTEWQRFALIVMALVILVAVVVAYAMIKNDLARML
jgi:hypothetical protein